MEPAAAAAASSRAVNVAAVLTDVDVDLTVVGLDEADRVGGSPLDFERLYLEHHATALRWATALMADREMAADVVQEAFLRIFSKVRPLRNPDAFLGYLRRTIVRTAASRWRSERRDAGRVERVHRLDGRPDAAALDETDDELLAAVRRLPARQRSVVVMRYWLDWSEHDIADALGCRPGTVKSLSSRALATLREEVDADA